MEAIYQFHSLDLFFTALCYIERKKVVSPFYPTTLFTFYFDAF